MSVGSVVPSSCVCPSGACVVVDGSCWFDPTTGSRNVTVVSGTSVVVVSPVSSTTVVVVSSAPVVVVLSVSSSPPPQRSTQQRAARARGRQERFDSHVS